MAPLKRSVTLALAALLSSLSLTAQAGIQIGKVVLPAPDRATCVTNSTPITAGGVTYASYDIHCQAGQEGLLNEFEFGFKSRSQGQTCSQLVGFTGMANAATAYGTTGKILANGWQLSWEMADKARYVPLSPGTGNTLTVRKSIWPQLINPKLQVTAYGKAISQNLPALISSVTAFGAYTWTADCADQTDGGTNIVNRIETHLLACIKDLKYVNGCDIVKITYNNPDFKDGKRGLDMRVDSYALNGAYFSNPGVWGAANARGGITPVNSYVVDTWNPAQCGVPQTINVARIVPRVSHLFRYHAQSGRLAPSSAIDLTYYPRKIGTDLVGVMGITTDGDLFTIALQYSVAGTCPANPPPPNGVSEFFWDPPTTPPTGPASPYAPVEKAKVRVNTWGGTWCARETPVFRRHPDYASPTAFHWICSTPGVANTWRDSPAYSQQVEASSDWKLSFWTGSPYNEGCRPVINTATNQVEYLRAFMTESKTGNIPTAQKVDLYYCGTRSDYIGTWYLWQSIN
jgi:hypothetical protein